MTQHTASHANQNNSRRAGFAVLAALGLPFGAMLAPGTVAAAPGDSLDDIDLDVLLQFDDIVLDPADWVPQPTTPADVIPFIPLTPGGFVPVRPTPAPPIPVPYPLGPMTPDDVPGPDDGPGLPFELPELDTPFVPLPLDIDDLVFPTGPGGDDADDDSDDSDDADDGDDADDADDVDDGEPVCNEYSAANFDVEVDRYDGDLIEVRLINTDVDVCDFTVWTAIAEPGAVGTLADTTVGMEAIAFATDSAMYYQQTFSDFDLCDLEIRVAVEESLAFTIPHTDPGCEPADGEEIPGDDVASRPLGEPKTPDTPETPSGGLPQTGTDLTTVMLALGLMTVGAGSIIALATRRREETPTA